MRSRACGENPTARALKSSAARCWSLNSGGNRLTSPASLAQSQLWKMVETV